MGELTGWLTVEMFCSCVAHNPVLHAHYLCTYMEENAKHVSLLHEDVQGIPGMLGSLDCMHVHWKNCPITYQAAYQGKKRFSTLVLEVITDHNLWFWHAAFGFTGSCNDINILDVSPLHQQFLDGSHSKVDFKFTIDEQVFNKLFNLVAGLYPQLSHFLKTISILIMKKETTLLDGRKLHGRMWNVQLGYCKASSGYWQVLWRCGMSYVFRKWLFHAFSYTR